MRGEFLIDALIGNTSDIQPKVIQDTQAVNRSFCPLLRRTDDA